MSASKGHRDEVGFDMKAARKDCEDIKYLYCRIDRDDNDLKGVVKRSLLWDRWDLQERSEMRCPAL